MRNAIAIAIAIAFIVLSGASNAKPAHMPLSFCKELRHIDARKQPITYRDTFDACRWDFAHPVKR